MSLLNPKSKFCFYACLKLIFASTSGRSVSLRKQLFLLAPQHLRTLREGLSATQRQKFHTDDINQCFIINPVVMGFQMQICSILRFSWSFKCNVFICEGATAKLKCVLQRGICSTNIDCFCYRFIAFIPL